MTHESERHDACCWEDVGLGELEGIGWARTSRGEIDTEKKAQREE